jgi:hypothetical protein
VDSGWASDFADRLRSFEQGGPPDSRSVSIKIRVTSGCFHREHSPIAYALIDERVSSLDGSSFSLVEHESGPEILIFIGALAGAFQLTSSVIDLVTTIIRARHVGVKKGDDPAEPLELLVRRFDEAGTLREEVVLRVAPGDRVLRNEVGSGLASAIERITDDARIEE